MPHNLRAAEGAASLKVCDLSGRMDASGTPALKLDLDAMLAQSEVKLVVSLGSLESISASGINVLLDFAKQARSAKGDVRFFGANPDVARLLDLAGFNRYFKFYATEEEAVKAFGD